MNLVLFLALATRLAASPAADTLSVDQIRTVYPDLLSLEIIQTPSGRALALDTRKPPEGHPFAGLIHNHGGVFGYLVLHGAGFPILDVLTPTADSMTIVRSYFARLARDSVLEGRLLPVVERYLTATGSDLAGYDAPPRIRVPLVEVVEAAARLYYPERIEPDGTVRVKVCFLINGFLEDYPRPRNLHVEALAYASLLRDMWADDSPLRAALDAEFNQVKQEQDLPAEPSSRLVELRRRIWARLARHEGLRHAVLAEYEQHQAILPFVIVETPSPSSSP